MAKDKNKYGQYMTPEQIAEFMVSLSDAKKEGSVLEPSSGEGIFLSELKKQGYKNVLGYEIDSDIAKGENVKIGSFVTIEDGNKYDLIIGNPPYIRWKNLEDELKDELANSNLWKTYCTSLSDYSSIFILKSVSLLKEGGELIFITPEYWLSTTHSKKMRDYLSENGYFESIYHFNETPIFDDVNVSTVIFKYVKKKSPEDKKMKVIKFSSRKKISVEQMDNLKKGKGDDIESFTINQFKVGERWVLTPKETLSSIKDYEKKCSLGRNKYTTIGDVCDIGNGMVSGLDKAFQIDFSSLNKQEKQNTIQVAKAKNLKTYSNDDVVNYCFLKDISTEKELKKDFPNFYKAFQPNKEQLNKRYQYGREINYWDWVFLRNYNLFSRKEKKIFVPCKERISNKDYFRFAIVDDGIYPTQDVAGILPKEETRESIYYIVALLNSREVFNWLLYNGIVKGDIVEFSKKPISIIPFRAIDFENQAEVSIYNKIVDLVKSYIEKNEPELYSKINIEFKKLLNL